MTATLNQIAGYLENRDWQYDLQTQKFRIVTGVIGDNIDPLAITITLFAFGIKGAVEPN